MLNIPKKAMMIINESSKRKLFGGSMTNTDTSICAKIKIHEVRNKVCNSKLSTCST
jgi:hypothetical protein